MALSFLLPQECFWPKYSSMLNVESQRPKVLLRLTTSSHLVLRAVKSVASDSDLGINFRNILNSWVRATFIFLIGKSKNA